MVSHKKSGSRYSLKKWGDGVRCKMKAQVTWLGISVNRYSCRAGSKQERPPAFLRGWLRALTKFMFIGKSTLALTADAVVQSPWEL